MTLLFIIITLLYLLLIGSLALGFDKVNNFKLEDINPKIKFSIVIPFRNEAKNLSALLQSISQLNYPKSFFEIILIDDASEDESIGIINAFSLDNPEFRIKLIPNERQTNSPKKDAISTAILTAKNDWVITTDADCILPKYWLDTFDGFIQANDCKLIVAPVTYNKIDTLLNRFQLLDFLSLIGATIGGFGIKKPFLCNGANLGYSKSFFNLLNGFEGNTDIASGDDIFLLEKGVKQAPNSVRFLKSEHAIVRTQPQPNFSSLTAQRKRWAAKTSSYNSVFGKLTGMVVLLMNVALIFALTLSILGKLRPMILVYLFIVKCSIDFLLLFKTSRFFNQEKYLASFIFSSFLYPFFSVYIAFLSLFSKYEWKGRQFKK